MKTARRLFATAALAVALSSCGDSSEKLAKDRTSYITEMTAIITEVADGKLSSADAAKKIETWGKKGEEILKRQEALIKESGADAFMAVAEKHSEEAMKATMDFIGAIQKLQESGRLTPEIQRAIENVKQ